MKKEWKVKVKKKAEPSTSVERKRDTQSGPLLPVASLGVR